MTLPACWSCGAPRSSPAALCEACGKVQPVPPLKAGESVVFDKFAVLGVPRSFDLEAPLLEERFRALSRKLHPDRFARASAAERRYALEQTTRLNDAWRTLKDPARRGEHLLELRGQRLDRDQTMPPGFLEQVMEDRERLMEAKLEGGPEVVARLAAGVRAQEQEALAAAGAMLRSLEQGAQVALPEIAGQLARLRYYARYLDEVEGRSAEH
jgi:molecular chaperone HscB